MMKRFVFSQISNKDDRQNYISSKLHVSAIKLHSLPIFSFCFSPYTTFYYFYISVLISGYGKLKYFYLCWFFCEFGFVFLFSFLALKDRFSLFYGPKSWPSFYIWAAKKADFLYKTALQPWEVTLASKSSLKIDAASKRLVMYICLPHLLIKGRIHLYEYLLSERKAFR